MDLARCSTGTAFFTNGVARVARTAGRNTARKHSNKNLGEHRHEGKVTAAAGGGRQAFVCPHRSASPQRKSAAQRTRGQARQVLDDVARHTGGGALAPRDALA
jgi:hypothetical protein